jgi:hypothetical protein
MNEEKHIFSKVFEQNFKTIKLPYRKNSLQIHLMPNVTGVFNFSFKLKSCIYNKILYLQ